MNKKEKLIKRFRTLPRDFTFEEVVSLFQGYGFELANKGATSGSRIKFYNADDAIKFLKEYDQNMITYKKKNGFCSEIENLITNFFNEYPNGYIEYG